MENPSTLKNIHKLYNKLTYWDKYGTDLVVSLFIIVIFTWLTGYFYILNNLEPIKNNWIQERCNPIIMPFAGIINKAPNKTATQTTVENFTFCTQNVIKDIAAFVTKPVLYSFTVLNRFLAMILRIVNDIRSMLSKIRAFLKEIINRIFSRILNILISLQEIFIYIRDVIGKAIGTLVSGFYVLLGSYYTIKSTVGALFEFIVIILFILIGMIIPLWILPFTWGMAAFLTGVFLAIAIPLGIIAIAMNRAMGLTLSGIPGVPGCFDSETEFTIGEDKIKTKDLHLGDFIDKDNYITSKIKITSKDEKLYNLNNIFVTGKHKIYFKDKLIYVKDHPLVKECNKNKFNLYSFNTSKKIIFKNNIEFCDYDEMTNDEIKKLKQYCHKYHLKHNNSLDFIHYYFDGGFHENTEITLHNGVKKSIKDIEPDDVLEGDNEVIANVEIKSDDIYHKIKTNNENKVTASENLYYIHLGKDLQFSNISQSIREKNPSVLYHLITKNGNIKINNILFKDYHSTIESFL